MSYTAEDSSILARPIVESELQKFLALFYLLASLNEADADIQFLKIFKWDDVLNRSGLVIGCFVGFYGILQLLYLGCYHIIFYLGEKQLGLWQLLAGRQQIKASQLLPREALHTYHLPQSFTTEGQERFESDSQVGCQLQRDIDDGLNTLGVCLNDLPGLAVSYIFVTNTCQIHGLLLCLTELKAFQ